MNMLNKAREVAANNNTNLRTVATNVLKVAHVIGSISIGKRIAEATDNITGLAAGAAIAYVGLENAETVVDTVADMVAGKPNTPEFIPDDGDEANEPVDYYGTEPEELH